MLVIPEENEIGFDLSHRRKKIISITEKNMDIRKCLRNIVHAHVFALISRTAFDVLDILISCHDDRYVASLHSFPDDEPMARVDVVKCAEQQNFHG